MAEIWKDIPGYEGRYQASTQGRIRSVDRVEHCAPRNGKQPCSRIRKEQVLSTCLGSNGYPYVGLRKTQDAENATFCPAFHLIALTFLGPRPEGRVVCHSDGNKLNSALTNLRCDTGTENNLDLYRRGGKHGKLSVEQARDVKRRLNRGENKSSIARIYGISRTAVRYIAKGAHFGWLSV